MMPEAPQPSPEASPEVSELLRSLRRKEGTWVEWGQACQALQKAGLNSQTIFEETGFEPTHQNQVIVGSQVYGSLVAGQAPAAVQEFFTRKGSDILYEFRILTQPERVSAAELTVEKGLDVDEARDLAKAMKDFSRLTHPPEEFTNHPGDAIAYQAWKLARQKSDLQARSRLIAQGLRFAHSAAARKKIEALLTDFTVTPAKPAPSLPVYRLESDSEMPRILPVAGELPLATADFQAVPFVDAEEPFGLVKFSGVGAWVPVPGWQVVIAAEDPVVLLANSEQVPNLPKAVDPQVLVIVDRASRQWDANNYFLVDQAGQLQIQWFETEPDASLIGRVILVLRPKRIFDEGYTKELWQIDE